MYIISVHLLVASHLLTMVTITENLYSQLCRLAGPAPHSPESLRHTPSDVTNSIDIGQDNQNSGKPHWHWAVGGIEEGRGHHEEVEEDGCLYDVDMHLVVGFGKEVGDEYSESCQTHEELVM